MANSPFIAVRVPPDVIRSLDRVARKARITRPQLIRDLLSNCQPLYSFLQAERKRQQSERIALEGDISDWLLDNVPEGMTPDLMHFLGQAMHHVAAEMAERWQQQEEKPDEEDDG